MRSPLSGILRAIMRTRTIPALGLILLALSLAACASRKAITDSPNPPLQTVSIRVGSATVLAELALSETERERGLMFRKTLDEGKGMIFVFAKDDRLAFWMKNTTLPLSLAYIASDGTIRQIVRPRALVPRAGAGRALGALCPRDEPRLVRPLGRQGRGQGRRRASCQPAED